MLKLAHKTRVSTHPDQETATATVSLQAVKTLLTTGLGCVAWIRGLLSEDNFEECYLTGILPNLGASEPPSSQTSSGAKVTTIKRDVSNEANQILDYLEKGIFDALEKQYLKSFVFAIYLDQKDPKNLVEAYTFNVSYHEIGGTGIRAPVLDLEASMSRLDVSQNDTLVAAVKNGRPPTLGDVKRGVRNLIRQIVATSQSLETLPDRRYATFKIYYHDHTPAEYEPPNFVAGDSEKDRFFFSTHSVREAPNRNLCGESNTGAHTVRVEITSISDYLPSHAVNAATFTGLTKAGNVAQTFAEATATRDADIQAQRADAENRQIAWDADPADEDAPGEVDPDYKGSSQVPLGVRQGDKIVPISWKGKGKEAIRHRGGQHYVPVLDNARTSNAAPVEEATQLFETQATVLAPPSEMAPTQEIQRVADTQMDVDPDAGTQELDAQRDAIMDETQETAASMTSTQPAEAQDEAETRIHPAIDPAVLRRKSVDCYCGIEDEGRETFICQGPCDRRLHAWCMGFNTAEEVTHSQNSTCVECALRADPVYDLMPESNRQGLRGGLMALAIYRRTLKLVYERGYPGNTHALQKLVGCTRPDAINNAKRMEDEGFIESRIVEFDSLGLIASSVPAKNAKNPKKKTNKKSPAKPQPVLVTTPAAKRNFKRYFEPQGEIMHTLLISYRPTKDKPAPPVQDTPAGNVLVPSSSINLPSQDPATPTRARTPPTQMDSQTQQETQTFVETMTPVLRPISKRRASTRISENQAKKMKISLAKNGVDLDTCEYDASGL
ncbi:DNA binding protein [Ceratobasidium sp. 392]|nr:DNA binding protein [Ceratobasidium sp. 392]